MRFAVLARVVVAAASVALVAATTLERRLPGTCSSSSYPKSPVPFCGRAFGGCSGDGCECTDLGKVKLGGGELPSFLPPLALGVSTRAVVAL